MNAICELPTPERCFPERSALTPDSVGPNMTHPGSALRRMIGALIRWRRRRAAIRALRALNDHYLADIGLERVQVASNLEEMIRQTPGEISGMTSSSGGTSNCGIRRA